MMRISLPILCRLAGVCALTAGAGAHAARAAYAEPLRAPAAAPAFFSVIDDLPLMPGMSEVTERSVVFDKPDGRILEARGVSAGLTESEVLLFYGQALPQLGWKQLSLQNYMRGNEILTLAPRRDGKILVVDFMVEPR